MCNDYSSFPFEDELDRLVEEHTSPKRMVKIDIKPTFLAISQEVLNGIVYNFTLRCSVAIYTPLIKFSSTALVEVHTSPKRKVEIDISPCNSKCYRPNSSKLHKTLRFVI